MRFTFGAALVFAMIAPLSLPAGDLADGGPVTFVIPYGPGGGYDTIVRLYAPRLAEVLGTPVLPMNVAGASGIRGAQTVYRAAPDGSMIGIFNLPGMLVSEVRGVDLGFDLDAISWIASLGAEPQGVAVAAGSAFATLEDLCASGSRVRLSETGALSTGAVTAQILFETLGCPVTMVFGYQGAAEAAVAVMRGDVEATLKPLGSLAPLVASGDLRMIVTLTDSPVLDGIQTAADIGHPELAGLTIRRVVGGPPGMDPDLTATFADAIQAVFQSPAVQDWSLRTGLSGGFLGSADTAAMLKDLSEFFSGYHAILAP